MAWRALPVPPQRLAPSEPRPRPLVPPELRLPSPPPTQRAPFSEPRSHAPTAAPPLLLPPLPALRPRLPPLWDLQPPALAVCHRQGRWLRIPRWRRSGPQRDWGRNRSCKATTPVAVRAPRTMPPPGQVAADPTAEAIGAATPAAVAAAAVVPQSVHAIEVLRTARAASAAGKAVVAPRVLADADVALRAPAVEVVREGALPGALPLPSHAIAAARESPSVALRAPRTMPRPGQVAADPTAEAIGAATPAAVAAAAVVPQPVHAIEVLRTVRAASAAGQAIVDPRVLADADVALRAPAVEVVREGALPLPLPLPGHAIATARESPSVALRAPRTMPLPGQVAADPTAEAIGAATPAAVAAAAVVPQPVHAIEVPRTVRAASAAGQAIVDPRVLADADVALRAPAVEVVRVGRGAPMRLPSHAIAAARESPSVALRAPRTMPPPGQVAADPTAEAIGAATPAAVAAAAVVPQSVHAIEVLRTARAASAAGKAVVAPRVLADADVALRAPAVEVVRVGRAAAAAAAASHAIAAARESPSVALRAPRTMPLPGQVAADPTAEAIGAATRLGPQSQLQGDYARGSEGAPHYATARAGGCESHGGGDRGPNAIGAAIAAARRLRPWL